MSGGEPRTYPPTRTAPPPLPTSQRRTGPAPATSTPAPAKPTAETRPAPSRRQLRRRGLVRGLVMVPLSAIARTLVIVLPLLLLGVALLYVRLIYSPVSVSFLAAPIERALNTGMPGFAFGVGDAVLQRTPSGGIEFRLKSVRMNDSRGAIVALAKTASVEMNPWALLSGRIAPSRIDLIEARFLIFDDDGDPTTIVSRLPVRPALPGSGPAPPADPAPAAEPTPERTPEPGTTVAKPASAAPPGMQRLDLIRLLAETLGKLRRDGQAASYIESFGLRDATVILDEAGRQTICRIPEMTIDLLHKQKRSIVDGRGRIVTGSAPWSFAFRAEESEKSHSIGIEVSVKDLVPRALARHWPRLAALDAIDAPVAVRTLLDVSTAGDVTSGRLEIDLGRGTLAMPWLTGAGVGLQSGRLDLSYNAGTRTFELLPSPIVLVPGRMTLTGRAMAVDAPTLGARPHWRFDVRARDGTFAGGMAGAPDIPIEKLEAKGVFGRVPGRLEIEAAVLRASGAEVTMAAATGDPAASGNAALEGRISPMPLAALTALWPEHLAPAMRSALVTGLKRGSITGGTFRIGGATDPTSPDAGRRLSLALEAADVLIMGHAALPPVDVPRALMRLEGNTLEIAVPEATMAISATRKLTLKAGRVTVAGLDTPMPVADMSGRLQGPLPGLIDLAAREPFHLLRGLTVNPAHIDGRLDAQLRISVPLASGVTLAAARVEGTTRIIDGRIKDLVGPHDLTGANIAIEASGTHLDIKGEMLLGGVVAKINGRWPLVATSEPHPPLRIAVRTDDADRAQLGLELHRFVTGEIPLDIVISGGAGATPKMHVTADLTAAELQFDDIHWVKPPGRPAKLDFDVARGATTKAIELQNFKLDGDGIAIDGWVALGPDNRAREYYFPEFVVGVVSRLELQGTLRPDRVWEVKVRGKSPFDATAILRAMLVVDQPAAKPPGKNRPGVELTAEFDTVLGLEETRLKQVRLHLQKRNDQIVAIDFRCQTESGRPLLASMRPTPGTPRIIRLESTDAGQALKVIGFYRSMVGGTGTMELNLDGRGPAEKVGRIVIRDFRVLGDPVASEVFQAPDDSRPFIDQGRRARRIVREQFEFEQLVANFSTGSGQLVIESATARGPIIGASMRGKIDFRSRRLQVGGTYVPLSGLYRGVSEIPLIGPLLTGPRGEGIVGFTFAVQGAMANPQVIVNPFSPFALGVFREVMQMTPENPRITPRVEPRKRDVKGGGPQIRASDPAAPAPAAVAPPGLPAEVIGDWSTTAKGTPAPKPKR